MFDKIFVAVDGSKDSYRAVEIGINMAKKFGCHITFVYVSTRDYIEKLYGDESKIKKSVSPFDDFLLEQARTEEIGLKVFQKIKEIVDKEDHNKFETKMLSGKPSEQILNEINSWEYDLVIVGRHGASKAQKALFGSATEPLLTKAKIPVMIV
ncbi:MAG: universal stress protein [Candidatus Hodarchaeota archaeon]